MANEISISLSMQARKGKVTAAMNTGALGASMAGNNLIGHVQEIAAVAEPLDLGDVVGAQLLAVRHAGDAGTVALSMQADGSNPFATLAVGGPPALLPTPAATIYAKASAGTIPVEVVAAEA